MGAITKRLSPEGRAKIERIEWDAGEYTVVLNFGWCFATEVHVQDFDTRCEWGQKWTPAEIAEEIEDAAPCDCAMCKKELLEQTLDKVRGIIPSTAIANEVARLKTEQARLKVEGPKCTS